MTYDEAIHTLRDLVRWAATNTVRFPTSLEEIDTWAPPPGMIAVAMGLVSGTPTAATVPRWALEHGEHPLSAPPTQPGPCLVLMLPSAGVWLWSYWDGADWRGVYDRHDQCVAVQDHSKVGVIKVPADGVWRGTVAAA